MPKNDKRVKITLECTECKRRNYITMKSKINDRERLEMKKYCSHERKHTVHKETLADTATDASDQRQRGMATTACVAGERNERPASLGHPQRAVAQLVEHRSPKPTVGGSSPSCPAPQHLKKSGTHVTR